MVISDYNELDLTYLNVDDVRSPRSILRADYGDGYADTAMVGARGGRKSFQLSAGVWPDGTDQPLIGGETIFEYYWSFFEDRLDNGNEPFIIEWRNHTWLVELANPEHGVETHTSDLFTPHGIAVNARRVSGLQFLRDGSAFDPTTINSEIAYYSETRSAYDGDSEWQTTGGGDIWGPVPVIPAPSGIFTWKALGTDVIQAASGSRDVIRFSSTTNDGVLTPDVSGSYTYYDIFLLMKMREATFSNNGGIITGATAPNNAALVGASGTTKFFNFTFGSTNYEYKKDGVAYAENDQQAPMNEWGIVHLRFPSGITLVNPQLGKDRDFVGRFAEMDLAYLILSRSRYPAAKVRDIMDMLTYIKGQLV